MAERAYNNSAARAVAVVEFLAAQPDRSFSLSEIARRCDLGKSTAHTILATLHERGWVTRSTADLSYGLGPTLIMIAEAAGHVRPEVRLARPVIEELAVELGRVAVLSMAVGDEILILDYAGVVGSRPSALLPGDRVPLVAPFGAVFVAWESETAREDWYRKSGITDPDHVEQMDEILNKTVRRGYLVTLKSDLRDQFSDVMRVMSEDLTVDEIRNLMRQRLASLSPVGYLAGSDGNAGENWLVDTVQAPIFDLDGVARYALTITPVDRPSEQDTLDGVGQRVRRAADRITDAIAAARQIPMVTS